MSPHPKTYTPDDIAHLVEEQINAAEVSQRLVRTDEERRRFRALAECSPVGVFETDTEGACTYTNRRWQEITGLSGAAALGQGWLAAIYSEDVAQVQEAWQDAALRRGDFRRTFRFRRPSGEVRWVHVQASPVRNSQDEVICWVGVDEDITEVRALQEALSESETRLKQLAEASDDVFWLMDANTHGLLYISPAYERVWKRNPKGALQTPAGWLDAVHPCDLARAKAALDRALESGKPFELELRVLLPDGSVRHALSRGFPVVNTDGVVARLAGVVSDITSLHDAREELKHLASVDELTGVSNSRTFRELLAHEVHRATRNKTSLSLAFIDIDHFKSVNDNFGHAAGDLVIKTVADVVRRSLRSSDALARVGGDEFCILLPECDQDGAEKSLGEVLRRLSASPISLGGQAMSVTLSIGIASAQGASLSETELLEQADLALYEAKYLGRNQICRHDTMAPRSRDSRLVESSRRHTGGASPAPESTRATVDK